uniref:Uncharacterized protein n=1 Tax=Anguilla anguilla TaxID=7936 RepID=A0A0E9RYW3_ANGAN
MRKATPNLKLIGSQLSKLLSDIVGILMISTTFSADHSRTKKP